MGVGRWMLRPNALLQGLETEFALGPELSTGGVHGRVFRRGQTSRERRMREYRDAETLALVGWGWCGGERGG